MPGKMYPETQLAWEREIHPGRGSVLSGIVECSKVGGRQHTAQALGPGNEESPAGPQATSPGTDRHTLVHLSEHFLNCTMQ